MCVDCYTRNLNIARVAQRQRQQHQSVHSQQIIQPHGTVSSSSSSKCEVISLRVDPPSSSSARLNSDSSCYTLVIQYHLYTNTEQVGEELFQSHRSRLYCGGSSSSSSSSDGSDSSSYPAISNTLFERGQETTTSAYRIHGETSFQIPVRDVDVLLSSSLSSGNSELPSVRFVYDDRRETAAGHWSEAILTLPDNVLNSHIQPVIAEVILIADSVEEVATNNNHSNYKALPRCHHDLNHIMTISDYAEGPYRTGYVCDRCRSGETGLRWHCHPCSADYCFDCEPLRTFVNVLCDVAVPHEMMLCGGDRYGSRVCDECRRSSLEHDPEFYCCTTHNYDLCLCCASQHQAIEEI